MNDKLTQAKALSEKLKAKLKKAKMRENLGQKEARDLNDFIGADMYTQDRMGYYPFITLATEFDVFVDNL